LVRAKTGDITRTVRVAGLIDKRVGAAIARDNAEDLTPPEEYAKREEPILLPPGFRPKGAGRPTKRERRELDAAREDQLD
jgi:ribosome-associated heat shock protein Hsp15